MYFVELLTLDYHILVVSYASSVKMLTTLWYIFTVSSTNLVRP